MNRKVVLSHRGVCKISRGKKVAKVSINRLLEAKDMRQAGEKLERY